MSRTYPDILRVRLTPFLCTGGLLFHVVGIALASGDHKRVGLLFASASCLLLLGGLWASRQSLLIKLYGSLGALIFGFTFSYAAFDDPIGKACSDLTRLEFRDEVARYQFMSMCRSRYPGTGTGRPGEDVAY